MQSPSTALSSLRKHHCGLTSLPLFNILPLGIREAKNIIIILTMII